MSPSLKSSFESLLDLAPQFSTSGSSAMSQRDELLKGIRAALEEALESASDLLAPDVQLKVKEGGRQTYYSPTPWIRIYSPDHSPSAQDGAYLVYLFAADGSAVFLSLNQGTSEFRSGHMRPINNQAVLRGKAAEARNVLSDLESTELISGATEQIDLRWAEAPVGSESRMRIRNYEDANILARYYSAGAVPSDDVLLRDLSDFLILLRRLYLLPDLGEWAQGDPVPPGSMGSIAAGSRSRSQGRIKDYEVRRAIEIYAEDRATAALLDSWDEITRVGQFHRGYDLECRSGEKRLHVEVKGTRSVGLAVSLTIGEVRHLPSHGGECPAGHALFVCSEIDVDRSSGIKCSGGVDFLLMDWTPSEGSLTPTQYDYQVPRPGLTP